MRNLVSIKPVITWESVELHLIIMYVKARFLKDWNNQVLKNCFGWNVIWMKLKKAEKVLKTGGYNVGLTYSSFEHRCSIVVIGLTTSADEFQNTFDHEKGHLAAHIKDACNLDAEGEEYQYLTGEVGQKMFKIAKRFLCDDCRSKYLLIANRL